jgi:hypothetical protein
MNDQSNNQDTAKKHAASEGETGKVNIHPSEPENDFADGSEENAPGRTPGKAEGSSEIVEADLDDAENQ